MRKRNVLVTGAAGMMGSHCVDYLVSNYGNFYNIHAVDDLSGCYKENINKKSKFKKLDLRNYKKTKKYFFDTFYHNDVDYLIHFASAAHEIRSYFTPIENMSRNDEAFRNTLTYAVECGVKHVIFFSSMSRYGSGDVFNGNNKMVLHQTVPFKESYIPAPEDPYACAKVNSENMLRAFSKVHKFTYTIWVPHNCFSERQFVDPYRNVIAIWLNLILMNKDCVIYGDGLQKRAISWVDDFNPIICESMFDEKTYGQIINIGGDEHKTLNEWYTLVNKITGYGKEAIHLDPRPGEVFYAYCNHDKAEKLTGFKNTTNLEDAISEMWYYFKKKGPRKFKYLNGFEIDSPKIPITWKKKLF
jgi:UDP-glucose 4-epimerase